MIKPRRRIVLLGIGHTNAYIVKRWIHEPIPGVELVCVSDFPQATYSGMLPGTLAGQYSRDEMQIDLHGLAERAHARLMLGKVTGVNRAHKTLEFENKLLLEFDALSIGIGSRPADLPTKDHDGLLPIKPMQTFVDRLDARLDNIGPNPQFSRSIVIVGGGVAGLEIAMCLHTRLRMMRRSESFRIQIITAGKTIGDGLNPRGTRIIARLLAERGIEVLTNQRVNELSDGTVVMEDGSTREAGCMIWATGASAPPLLENFDLPADAAGFLETRLTLQSIADPSIFAVGDSGSIVGFPTAKAGVYAVRQAPILWHNLNAMMTGKELREYIPQTGFLKILNTGDGSALLEYKSFSLRARWCMTLKTMIDRRFIKAYQ